jgi:polysaccharide chain length determinant protein (PEP-CTERM system associated)
MAAQILSRPRLSRIIDELGLYADESNYLVRDELINLMREQIRVEPVLPELEQAQAFRRATQIDQFRIYFHDNNAHMARDVAQRLANDFIEEHIASRVRTSQKSLEFIDAELNRLSDQIGGIEKQISDLKAANSGTLPEDMGANQRLMERLANSLAAARREAAAARSDEAFFRSQSATARELVGRSSDSRDTPESRMRMLELSLADFKSRGLTDKHPDVISTRKELEILEGKQEEQRSKTGAGSFAEHSAEAEAERARNRRLHAEEEIARLEEEATQVQSQFSAMPGIAEKLDAFDREYKHLFSSYQDFSNRRLEASVQADLERRQLGEQFRVLESAFVAREPTSPNRPVIVAIGLIFGLAMGAGIGIVLEAADSSVHTARQLQAHFDLPVLAAIPEIWLESDRVRLRRLRIRNAVLAMGATVFVVIGGWASYHWVNPPSQPASERQAGQTAQREAAPAE